MSVSTTIVFTDVSSFSIEDAIKIDSERVWITEVKTTEDGKRVATATDGKRTWEIELRPIGEEAQ